MIWCSTLLFYWYIYTLDMTFMWHFLSVTLVPVWLFFPLGREQGQHAAGVKWDVFGEPHESRVGCLLSCCVDIYVLKVRNLLHSPIKNREIRKRPHQEIRLTASSVSVEHCICINTVLHYFWASTIKCRNNCLFLIRTITPNYIFLLPSFLFLLSEAPNLLPHIWWPLNICTGLHSVLMILCFCSYSFKTIRLSTWPTCIPSFPSLIYFYWSASIGSFKPFGLD